MKSNTTITVYTCLAVVGFWFIPCTVAGGTSQADQIKLADDAQNCTDCIDAEKRQEFLEDAALGNEVVKNFKKAPEYKVSCGAWDICPICKKISISKFKKEFLKNCDKHRPVYTGKDIYQECTNCTAEWLLTWDLKNPVCDKYVAACEPKCKVNQLARYEFCLQVYQICGSKNAKSKKCAPLINQIKAQKVTKVTKVTKGQGHAAGKANKDQGQRAANGFKVKSSVCLVTAGLIVVSLLVDTQ